MVHCDFENRSSALFELWSLVQGKSEGFIYPLAFAFSPFTWRCYSRSLIPSAGANGATEIEWIQRKSYSRCFQVLWVT